MSDACPSDEELVPMLAGESAGGAVESHLRGCPACRRRLDLIRTDLAALRSLPAGGPGAAPAPAPRPSRIGKYLIVGELAAGGRTRAYRALHATLDTELVITLGEAAGGRGADHRPSLTAEGKRLATLDHPNLARVYDLDLHAGAPFLAAEYVRGPDLREHAAREPVTPRRAAGVVAAVARALAVAHRNGVVHQDIGPHAILIDATGRPRLTGLGTARLRRDRDDGPADPRGDLLALGGVLHFLLTGTPPAEDAPGALDRPAIPGRLRKIGRKATAAGYVSAADLAADLERYLTRPGRLVRLALAAAVLTALGVGLWAVLRP